MCQDPVTRYISICYTSLSKVQMFYILIWTSVFKLSKVVFYLKIFEKDTSVGTSYSLS